MENTTESITVIMENKRKRVALFGIIVFSVIAIVAGAVFCIQTVNRKRAEALMEELAANTYVENADAESEGSTEEQEPDTVDPLEVLRTMGVPIPNKTVDFADLQENTNADIYAWIYIPESKIDYPIVQHPTDNGYYLNYNLDGSKGYPGCIYTENYNSKDFTDPNTVVYGHNMKNGTMFAGLHNFEDVGYFEANPYVYIYTPDELLVYEIFAAYEYDDSHILYNYDFTNETVYQNYLDEVVGICSASYNIREDVKVTTEDKIITLSTCIANKPDMRYLVQGVLINEK